MARVYEDGACVTFWTHDANGKQTQRTGIVVHYHESSGYYKVMVQRLFAWEQPKDLFFYVNANSLKGVSK